MQPGAAPSVSRRLHVRVKAALVGAVCVAIYYAVIALGGLGPQQASTVFVGLGFSFPLAVVTGALAGAMVGASRPRMLGASIVALTGMMFSVSFAPALIHGAYIERQDGLATLYSFLASPTLMAILGAGIGALVEKGRVNARPPT